MKPYDSLKKTPEFLKVYKKGKSKANKYFVIYISVNGISSSRLGVSVSKKIGNSVVRHRITRLIREVFRLHRYEIKDGYDIVIVSRKDAAALDYQSAEKALMHLINLQKMKR